MKIAFRAPLLAALLLASMEPLALAEGPTRSRTQLQTALPFRQRAVRPQGRELDREKFLRRILPRLAGKPAFRTVAHNLGLTEWRGRRLDFGTKAAVSEPAGLMALDQPVDTFDGSQNQPSIAVDPTDEATVVVFAQNEANILGVDVACSIYLSFDSGVTFTYADDVPLVNADDTCAGPVVRFAPDGSVVYYNYLSIRADGSSSDVMVTVAEGDNPTTIVSGPTIVLPGGTDFVDANWLGVHTFDAADGVTDGSGYVYVTGTAILAGGSSCVLLVNRSADFGVTWDFGTGAFVGGGASDCDVNFLDGARVDGGPGGQVLICYYNSEADGATSFLLPPVLSNRFDITCTSSADRWDTPSAPITAANNVGFELNYILGPNELYHVWWPGMLPTVAIDHLGNAHVTFAMDPTASKVDAESGNVQYMRSKGGTLNPPYTTWLARLTLGSGARAQGFPTLAVQQSNLSTNPSVYVAYYDHFRSTSAAPNRIYDVRFRKSINGGATFTGPVRVTDVVSLSESQPPDGGFIGAYFGISASMRRLYLAWTDRADKTNILDIEDDILADRY